MHAMLQQWAGWIANTRPSLYLQRQQWIIIISQSVHIVCVGFVFSAALLISLRLLGLSSRRRRISELVHTLVPWIYRALLVLLLTGIEQTIAEPYRQFGATPFFVKMGLILIALGLTMAFARAVRSRPARWDDAAARPAGARIFAFLWLALWVGIIFCGRFIGYAATG